MANRNISSLVRTVSNLKTPRKVSPSVKNTGLKVLRQLGVIKPQRRATAVTQLRKLFK